MYLAIKPSTQVPTQITDVLYIVKEQLPLLLGRPAILLTRERMSTPNSNYFQSFFQYHPKLPQSPSRRGFQRPHLP